MRKFKKEFDLTSFKNRFSVAHSALSENYKNNIDIYFYIDNNWNLCGKHDEELIVFDPRQCMWNKVF